MSSAPVIAKLGDFVEFVAGLVGEDPRNLTRVLREAVRELKPAQLVDGYILEVDPASREIRLVKDGVVYAVYRRS